MEDGKIRQTMNEMNIGGVKYLHKLNDQFDYLIDRSNNGVKIHLKFTKDQEKRNEAKNALKTFFIELL